MLPCIAVCCSVLHCDAGYCSVLQCVAVCCSVVQCVTVCCSVLQCHLRLFSASSRNFRVLLPGVSPRDIAENEYKYTCLYIYIYIYRRHSVDKDSPTVCCCMLQCVAMCCSVLQCVAVCCSMLPLLKTHYNIHARFRKGRER